MSVAGIHSALARLESWLPGLDRERVRALVGEVAVAAAERDGLRLASRPRPLASQLVQGLVTDAGGTPCETSAGVGSAGEVACHCSCATFEKAPPCAHVAGLLLACAASPALREQILEEARPRPVLRPTAAARPEPPNGAEPDRARVLSLLRERGVDGEGLARRKTSGLLETTFQAWRRRGGFRPLGESTFYVGVEAGDPDAPDPGPSLTVRVQPNVERRPFGPDDLESRRLPASEWRLFQFLGRPASGARNFVARGRDATAFLDRAGRSDLELRGEDGEPLTLLDLELRPALRLRAARDEEIAGHPVLLARAAEAEELRQRVVAAWRRYSTERAPIRWEDFLAILGVTPDKIGSATDVADAADVAGARALDALWIPARRAPAVAVPAEAEASPTAAEESTPLSQSIVFTGPRSWVFLRDARTFARVAPDVGPIALARLVAQPAVLVAPAELSALPALLREQFDGEGIDLPAREQLGLPALPMPRITLRLSGSAFTARARLEARYGEQIVALAPDRAAHPDDASRHAELERAALSQVATTALERVVARRRRRGGALPDAEASEEWIAEGDAAIEFWTRDVPRLFAASGAGTGIDEIVIPSTLRHLAVRAPLRSALTARGTGKGLIDVALAYASEGVAAEVDEIRQALAAKRRWVRLTDGSVAEKLSERVARLATATQEVLRRAPGVGLSAHALGEIAAWRSLADSSDLDAQLASWADRLNAVPTADPGPIEGLTAELRAYQRSGVAWLQLLADIGAGGILADDMGLGKTVQALALLAWRRQRDGMAPSLVVAPTSVALNWCREAERFVPGLRPLLLHGVGRHERYDQVAESDIVVTTYALLRRDVERLRDIAFRYVILDEAQQIKNHTAATTAAAKSLVAEARIALTGTPVENRLLELWSILDFCNPGMLGSWRSFAGRYERPVAEALGDSESAGPAIDGAVTAVSTATTTASTNGNGAIGGTVSRADAAAILRARIRPFVLRRTKAEVQRDLPPKIESDVAVELTPAQRRAYAALAAAARADLAPVLAREGVDRHRMRVLTALLRLRQMACDPRLVDPRHRPEDSAKLLALRELTSEVIASGRRALVFSQFVELLTLVRRDLDDQGVSYSYLDGRTRDRQGVIDGFVNGTDPLFLLSLRAGGTGINLAAADVVIHLDPWWNPAVEEQATDRAHRIGQTRTVSVYRIVAAGTIEEAIMRMKRRKRALASSVIDTDTDDRIPLTESDVQDLLSFTD